MPSVPLVIIGQGPYIKAPDCCPYKETVPNEIMDPGGELLDNGQSLTRPHVEQVPGTYNRINPVICAVCRRCYFEPKAMVEDANNTGGC